MGTWLCLSVSLFLEGREDRVAFSRPLARPHPTVLAPFGLVGLGLGDGACVVDFRDSRQEVSLVGGEVGRQGQNGFFHAPLYCVYLSVTYCTQCLDI